MLCDVDEALALFGDGRVGRKSQTPDGREASTKTLLKQALTFKMLFKLWLNLFLMLIFTWTERDM